MMMRSFPPSFPLAVAAALVLCGCSAQRTRVAAPLPPEERPALAAASSRDDGITSPADARALAALARARAATRAGDEYRIGPDDLLEIHVPDLLDAQAGAAAATRTASSGGDPAPIAGTPVFQQGARVNSAGIVTIPMIGAVHAGGLTATGLEQAIARRLTAAGILRHPQVSVQIVEYRSGVVAVVGSVEHPGLYPVTRPHASIADLIWAAGGPSKDAGRIVEFAAAESRGPAPVGRTDVGAAPLRLDLNALLRAVGATERNPQARPGDVINVALAGSVLVDGWVDKPGSYPVTRGLTVSGAIAAAGGRLFAADRSRVTVTRVVGPEQRASTLELAADASGGAPDLPISDGDIVHVPVAPARVVPWGLWTVAREMVHVGGSVLLF